MNNPYSAPTSDVNVIPETNGLHVLPRFSAWGVAGLTIITFGIYYMYWLYSRTTKLNNVVENKVPMWLGYLSIVSYLFYMAMNMIPESSIASLTVVFGILSVVLVYIVSYYWWLYAVRSRITVLANDSNFKIGGIKTFFFQPLYLQYKINQYHDQHTE